MQRYAKITNEETGAVAVAIGDPEAIWKTETVIIEPPTEGNPEGVVEQKTLYVRDYYESLGMELLDVEQAHDGAWYLAGKAPAPPETKIVRTFSKFSIWVATRELKLSFDADITVWQAFETFLHDNDLWSGWNQLNELVEDNEFFILFYPKAVEYFGKELVDNVLSQCVTSTKTVIEE